MSAPALRIDHILYAVADLEDAAARLHRELGLESLPGGRHPGWGTENRIIPLGGDYLELITVVDAGEAAASEFGRAVAGAVGEGDRIMGWAVATDDLDGVAQRVGLRIATGSRRRPDGTTLRWRRAGVAEALSAGELPFFIQWDVPASEHPGAAPAGHTVRPQGTAWVEVSGDADRIDAWLGEEHGLPLRIADGPPAVRALAIATAAGELVVR